MATSNNVLSLFRMRLEAQDVTNGELADRSVDKTVIWRDLGGMREENAYNMRLLSLTDPYEYTRRRNEAMAAVKDASEKSYIAAYGQQINAGASKSHAREFALKAGMATKNLQMEAMKVQFPDEDTKTYINKAYKDAKAFV